MRSRELKGFRRARQQRARRGRLILLVTLAVGLVTVAIFSILPGFSLFRAHPPSASTPHTSEVPSPPPDPPVVHLHDDVVELDGVFLARTSGIEKVQRIEPLYDALVRRRLEGSPLARSSKPRRLLLDIDAAERAIVVKSVYQTASFAGYTDIAFVPMDAGR